MRKAKDAKKKVSTQERILNAAMKMFYEHGFRDATTRQICAEAGVNVSLVNYYFRSKADLYKEVAGQILSSITNPMREIARMVHDEASWKDAVRIWVRKGIEMCAALKPPESYVARMIVMAETLPPEVRHELDQRYRVPMAKGFEALLALGLPDDDPLAVQLWASAINSQTLIYALVQPGTMHPGWITRYCPAGVSRKEWLNRVEDHMCDSIFSQLTFRPEKLGILATLDV